MAKLIQSISKTTEHNSTCIVSNKNYVNIYTKKGLKRVNLKKLGITYDSFQILYNKGYLVVKKIAKTLQGNVYLGYSLNSKQKIAIKITSKKLHENGITNYKKGKIIKIHENIVKEAKLMKYLQSKNPVKGFVKCIEFFNDDNFYYLIMDYGGRSFFDYVKHHTYKLQSKRLNPVIWIHVVKHLFKQIVLFVKFLHDNNCCHLDISLENLLIKNNIVYFCDFGLSEIYQNGSFKCNKYCGKRGYMSPEIHKKKVDYDPRKADTWSLGIVLFMMLTGCGSYKKPSISDPYYYNIKLGYLKEMVNAWDIGYTIPDIAFDLLNNILKDDIDRYNLNDILKHPFFDNV